MESYLLIYLCFYSYNQQIFQLPSTNLDFTASTFLTHSVLYEGIHTLSTLNFHTIPHGTKMSAQGKLVSSHAVLNAMQFIIQFLQRGKTRKRFPHYEPLFILHIRPSRLYSFSFIYFKFTTYNLYIVLILN